MKIKFSYSIWSHICINKNVIEDTLRNFSFQIMRKLKTYSVLIFLIALFGNLSKTYADVIYVTPLNGKEHKIGNLLKWVTSNEFNSQVFVIEKSIDGIDFSGIGEVLAGGVSQEEKVYRFLDVESVDPKAFYRLRQVDTDGTVSYSQTIMVKKKLSNDIMILSMSNTVTNDKFKVAVDAMVDGELEYTVKNEDGDITAHTKQALIFGINEVVISLKDEPEGIYFLTLQVEDEKEKLTIRKVNDAIQSKPNVASKSTQKGYR